MRGNAFGLAVEQLLLTARHSGQLEQALAWLDEAAPGLLDVDAEALPPKYRGAQPLLIDTWNATESRDEVLRRIGRIKSRVKSFGIDPLQNPNMRLGLLALNGETEQAVDVALAEIFSEPVTAHLDYPDKLARSYLETVAADPRVGAAIAAWDSDKADIRREVQRYLADVEA
jgi:hypothetical protein